MDKFECFVYNLSNKKLKLYVNASLIMYVFDILLFFLIGIAENSMSNIITGFILIFWLILTLALFNFVASKYRTFVFYIFGVTILGIIEETVIYYNGGGLNGTAVSLKQDILLVVPVFVFLGLALYIFKHKFNFVSSDFYVYGSIYGFILELIIGGKIGYFYLFLGPALVIYGSMLAAFAPKLSEQAKKVTLNKIIEIIIVLVVMFIFMIVGAIVGGMMYSILK